MPMDGTPIIIKRKKVHAHAHHGGSWKVAYADFVTAMMAFFLTLWIMGLSDSTRTQVAGYFSDPLGFAKTPPYSKSFIHLKSLASPKAGQARQPGLHQEIAAADVQKAINSTSAASALVSLGRQTVVSWGKDGIRIEFSESASTQFFQVGSDRLTPTAAHYVSELGTKLTPVLDNMSQTITVEGYTDARQYAGAFDNFDLSEERALSLKHALQQGGMGSDRFTGVVGYGDQKLRNPTHPYAAENRRVTLWIHSGSPSPDSATTDVGSDPQ